MITKERLEELIKEEKTIYCVDWGNYIEELELCAKDEIAIIGEVYNEPKECLRHYRGKYGGSDAYMFKNLFATKEEAEWHKEFGNITRTETLKLPTWEEFIKDFESIKNFGTYPVVDFDGLYMDIFVDNYGKKFIVMTTQPKMPLTKKNYTLACRKCKELFLGGENE